MKKLSKIMLTERGNICDRLRAAFEAMEQAVATYNEAMAAQWSAVKATTQTYNAVVAEANAWQEDVVSAMQEYIAERSNKWQDSERGHAYLDWQEEYESNDLEEIALDQPVPLELSVDDYDQADLLEGLTEESE